MFAFSFSRSGAILADARMDGTRFTAAKLIDLSGLPPLKKGGRGGFSGSRFPTLQRGNAVLAAPAV